MQVLMILYKSALDIDRVLQLFRERSATYQAIEGLQQKFYVREPSTNRVGGIYLFDSQEKLEAFRRASLENIRTAYQFTEPPIVHAFDVVQVLHDDTSGPAGREDRQDARRTSV